MEFWEEQIREILRQLKILCCSKCEPVSDWDIRCEERSVGEDELNTPGVVWYESRLVLPQVQEGQSLEDSSGHRCERRVGGRKSSV